MNDLDSFFDELPSVSDGYNFKAVLSFIKKKLKVMDVDSLHAFRARVLEMHPATLEVTAVLKVVDGLLALRATEGRAA